MASGPKDDEARAPALDDVKTERQAEAVERAKEAGAAGGAPVPSPSGDSPKRQGDDLENAVREAAGTPGKAKD